MAGGEEEGEWERVGLLLAAAPAWALPGRPDSHLHGAELSPRAGRNQRAVRPAPASSGAVAARGRAPAARRGLPQKPEPAHRAPGSTRSRAPPNAPARHPAPSALPSQLRLHLEEIAQSIPVGAVDPVIRDEAPGRRGHTGGDRRAGRGGARGHRDFEHLRGGTPEAAAAVATVAGARSPAASHRLRTQEREVASFKHTHTPTAASHGAVSRARAAVPFLHALAGGWAEKGPRNWETVWRENPSRRWRERGGGGTAKESGSLPLRSFPPYLPPPCLSNPPPFFFLSPSLAVAAVEPARAPPDAGDWGRHKGQSIIPCYLPLESGAWKRPSAQGQSLRVLSSQRALGAHGSGWPAGWWERDLAVAGATHLSLSASRWRAPPTQHQLTCHPLFLPLSKVILTAGKGVLWSPILQGSNAQSQWKLEEREVPGSTVTWLTFEWSLQL